MSSDEILTELGYAKSADHGDGGSSWEKPAFEIGDRVFVASACGSSQVRVNCPVCFGNRFVHLTLGNGEVEQIECSACGHGCDGPQGWVNSWAATSSVTEGTITGVSRSYRDDRAWDYDVNGSRQDHIFTSRDVAEAKRVELLAAAVVDAEQRQEGVIKGKKKGAAWSVRYHRECIKDAERKIAWHSARLGRIKPAEPTR